MAARKRVCAEMADGDVTRPGFGPGRGVALDDFGALESAVFGCTELVNARETGGQDAVGIGDEDAVHDAGVFSADEVPLPFAGPVIDRAGFDLDSRERWLLAPVSGALITTGWPSPKRSATRRRWLVGRRSISVAVQGLKRIGAGAKNADNADGVLGFIVEFAGENNFVADHRAVDHAGLAGGENVALPARVLIPDEFAHAAGERDEVGFAIVVDVGDNYLIAATEVGGDAVLDEGRGRRSCQKRKRQECEQTTHAPQYTLRSIDDIWS